MPTPRTALSTSLAAATTLPEKDADTTDDTGLFDYEIKQACKHLGTLFLQMHARLAEPPTMLCTDAEKLYFTSERSSTNPRRLWCELSKAARTKWTAQAERNEETNAQYVKNHLDMLKEARETRRDNDYDTVAAKAMAMATAATPAK